ncbi:hypothetical protein [Lactobacillus sp. LL6]|uniref:hypothetical protein n=1 Tax=Lactobacillus sp. LL6 TaxID=2596827 RepID=UPI0016435F8B|nr:hypothetical protein [Lactobacillus sp. LL6]
MLAIGNNETVTDGKRLGIMTMAGLVERNVSEPEKSYLTELAMHKVSPEMFDILKRM